MRRVDAENRQFQAIEELRIAVLEDWDGIPEDILVRLIGSVPNHVLELATSKRGSTRY